MSASPSGTSGYSPVAEWDRDMEPQDVFELSPRDKRARTSVSLKRKVDEVAAAASIRPGTGLEGAEGPSLRKRTLEY